jgi:uncharacterized membrane protein
MQMHAVDAMPFATQGPWFCAAVQMKFATTVQVLLECSVFICEKGALVAGIHAATAPLLVRLPILPLPMFMSATWVPGKSCSVCSWQCVLMAVCAHGSALLWSQVGSDAFLADIWRSATQCWTCCRMGCSYKPV